MNQHPVFLSVVIVLQNEASALSDLIRATTAPLRDLVSDYEVIIVDNGSHDGSVSILKELSGPNGTPNLQVYALTKEVDVDTAYSVGLENALGDFVAVFDPLSDDIGFLRQMLEQAASGTDVVFAENTNRQRRSLAYNLCYRIFNALYVRTNGVDLSRDAPEYRVLSRRVVNFIFQHPVPSIAYRHLPATGGFARANLIYSAQPKAIRVKRLGESIEKGTRLLVSTTRAPMRVVTWLCLFGAVSNVIYSAYVIAIALFKTDVEPGWITLSLQQSGMFFLLSLVLLVLGEYILQMASLSNEGPRYHVAQEFTSTVMTLRQRLNVEDAKSAFRIEAPLPTRDPPGR